MHQLEGAQHVVGRHVELRQPVVGEAVLRRRRRAPHRLLEADEELPVVLPVAHLVGPQRLEAARRHVGVEVDLLLVGQRQVARDQVRHQPDVGQPLDVGVAAQRVHAAAAHADIAEDELQHRHGADVLRALGVLRPAERVHRRHRLGRRGRLRDHLGDLQELVLRACRRCARPSPACRRRRAASGGSRRSADSAACRRPTTKPSSPSS